MTTTSALSLCPSVHPLPSSPACPAPLTSLSPLYPCLSDSSPGYPPLILLDRVSHTMTASFFLSFKLYL